MDGKIGKSKNLDDSEDNLRDFSYEDSEASRHLFIHRQTTEYSRPFCIVRYQVFSGKNQYEEKTSFAQAILKVKVGESTIVEGAEGLGPLDALYIALRKALTQYFPRIEQLRLADYNVRICDREGGTGVRILVEIEMSNGVRKWKTAGVSTNLIEASWEALVDAIEYDLLVAKSEVEFQKP
ncbi:MAG: hypothetical protein K9M08_14515 [Pirellula sp.]|nr:hypothetical protein [Pirellula sp.]